MRHPHAIWAIAAGLVVLSLPPLLSLGLFEEFRSAHSADRTERKVSGITAHNSRRGVAAYWSFDSGENHAPDRGIAIGTMSVPGVSGEALLFNGHDDTFFATDMLWKPERDFSVSFWMNAGALPVRQDIIFQGYPRVIGFRLEEGRLVFDMCTSGGVFTASCQLDGFDKFVHVAVTIEADAGILSIYLDGSRKGRFDFNGFVPPSWLINVGRCSQTGKRHPFHGVIDELVLWNRALRADEVRRMAASASRTRRAALKGDRRIRIALWRLMSTIADGMEWLAGLAEVNIPRYLRSRRGRASLSRVDIVAGKGALRRLARAHAESIASGHRTPSASRPVDAHIVIDGVARRCGLSLSGGTLCYPAGERMPFIADVGAADGNPIGGKRRVLIAPPEACGWLSRLADSVAWRLTGLPAPPPEAELVSLSINGHSVGVYVMCDASRMCVQTGDGMDPLEYSGVAQAWAIRKAEAERLSPNGLSDRVAAAIRGRFARDDFERYERRLRTASDIIMCDAHSPVPASLRAKALAQSLEHSLPRRDDTVCASSFLLDEYLVIGSNAVPWIVREDLDLSAVRSPKGWGISFHSESPEWIDDNGRIVKLPQGRPQAVAISASIEDADGGVSRRRLEFRLCPSMLDVAALMIWSPTPFGRTHRTDACVEIIDAHAGPDRMLHFTATASGGLGGIRYRGNTSFRSARKLLNVKLDVPHHLLGDTDTRSLLAINSYSDPLRVWSGLAFSLFRSFPAVRSGMEVAPHVRVFEVYCNGRYWGLQEFAERIDGTLLGDAMATVFRHMRVVPRLPDIRQAHPSPCVKDAMPSYASLISKLEAEPSEDNVGAVLAMIDIDNAIDYQILYSFMDNHNGAPYDFWTHDAIAFSPARGTMVFVPWDFDNSSLGLKTIVSTRLDKWLEANVPDFRERRAARWRELRRTVLDEKALLATYDAILTPHFGYLQSDRERWPSMFPQNVDLNAMRDKYKAFLVSQLTLFDKAFSE